MVNTPTAADFDPLITLYNARRYAELESQARLLLVKHPKTPFTWQLLGGALQMQGKDALAAFQKVAALSPNDASAHFNLGVAYKAAGQMEQSAASYRSALVLNPKYIEALSNLGNVLQDLSQLDEAVQCYRKALVIQPRSADTHYSLGNALRGLKQFEQAVESYQQVVRLKPDLAAAHCDLGSALKELGNLNEAVECYQRAIAIVPMFVEAHRNLGGLFRELGRTEEALRCYQQALQIQPDSAEMLSNLALIFYDLKQFNHAITSCQRAIALNPNYALAHNNLGLSLKAIGQLDSAVTSYRSAIACDADCTSAYNNLGNTLKDLRRYDEAIESYRQAIHRMPNFAEAYNNLGTAQSSLGQFSNAQASFKQALEAKPDYFDAHSNLLMDSCYISTLGPADYLAEALHFGESITRKVTTRFTTWQCEPTPQKLRVGIVSADLHSHPVGHFLESLLAQLNQSRIELIAYTNNPIGDALTARIKPYFSAWKPVFVLSDQATAQLIHNDGIHVLIDLSGHTAKNRLPMFAWKPAPVQVTWLGYFASTGVSAIDYLLADEMGVPESQRSHFSETIWYLPDTRLCFTPPDAGLPVASLPSLSNGYITFGCFQNLAKIGDAVLAVWGSIFAALPHARLRLMSQQLNDPSVVSLLQQRLQKYGITEERVSLYRSVPREAYLAAHAEVDVILDTFPYPGGTTTCEALWMGVPTLTLAGDTLLARQGASLLTAAGLPDWIATSENEYVAKAVHFASDLPKLAALRAKLREQVRTSPLFDAPRFASHFEEAMWAIWQAKSYTLASLLQNSNHELNLCPRKR
jgi:predicted O-linked N-acetylglucosamine transferase (SPINDLY family)